MAAAPAACLLLASGIAGAEAAVDAEDEVEEDDEEEDENEDEEEDEDAEMAASFRESGSGDAVAFLSDGSRLISEF